MTLTVIIPVYNEADTIQLLIDRVRNTKTVCMGSVIQKEIIVVDDCSTDGTRELLQSKLKTLADKVIFHDANRGKGAAIRSGIAEMQGDVMIVQDADLEYDPGEYAKLLTPILKGEADVVYGTRFSGSDAHRVLYFWHYVGNRGLTMLSNMFSNLNLTDMETCYKVFRKDVIQKIKLEQNRFGFEPEVTAKIAKIQGVRIYEVGISYHGRTYEQGKKINWKDGISAIWCIIRYNLFK
ncbi:MAG: glycosyltransferase family 2 protein [Bacteroidetes bacterium]|nr:glycosyltransferase family 2 protein [Bacteroidota bacterium]